MKSQIDWPREIAVSCWEAGPEVEIAPGEWVVTTCLLPDGHDGPCEFTRGDQIVLCVTRREEALDG